jgi:hypothetical protein
MVHDIVFCSLYLSNPGLVRAWIKYHHSIGVNHFYLFTLGKELDYMIKPLEDLSDIVTIINWPPTPYSQGAKLISDPNGMFGHWAEVCMQYYMAMIGVGKFEWIGNVSPDEFLVLEKDSNVKQFLDRYDDKKFIKLKWNYSKLDGMTYKEYLNFELDSFFKFDIKTQKNLRNHNGEQWENWTSTGYGKFFFRPKFDINICGVHQPIEAPVYAYGKVKENENSVVNESVASLYHFRYDRFNTKLPQGFVQEYDASGNLPDSNDSGIKRKISWSLTDNGKLIIHNRIRELIGDNLK